jgi:histidinol phosphatase-like PHP family hydrolase
MMELIYKNSDGVSVTLRQLKPFFLTKLDGVGRLRQTINTFHAPEQDGAFYISSTLDMRNITIEGTVLARNIEESFEYRKQLLRIFTPKLRGTLIYRNRQISCIVEEAGFTVGSVTRAPAFFISLLCPSPFFEALEEIRAELASWQENFSFPLEIIPPGIELGIRQPSQIITIDNIGDVASGCEIVFKALGSVENPELMNVDTGEYVKINESMTSGEEIHVFTHFAGKRVTKIIGTTETNAFSLLDVGSTFIQLEAGRNTLRYDAESNMDLLEVSIYYRPYFLGV